MQLRFQNFRATFTATAAFRLQGQNPRASKAAAKLEAGLNIISEAFAPVDQEVQAGTFNHDLVVSMCHILKEALSIWRHE